MSRLLSTSRGRFACWTAGFFLALALVGVLHHEIWRDEAEIWLIARDSSGPVDLVRNMRTQGHPVLWYALNFVLARFATDPLAMQLLHVVLATAAVLVFLLYAPFPRSVVLPIVFGYYLFYEYGVISRNYAPALLLGFAACAVLARRRRLDWAVAGLLFLMANTHLLGAVFAGLIGLAAVLRRTELIDSRGSGSHPVPRWTGPALLVLLGSGLGFGSSVVQSLAMGPAHLGSYQPGYDVPWFLSALGSVTRGFLPLPDPMAPSAWNSSALQLLPEGAALWTGAITGVVLLASCARVLRRDRVVLLTWALGAGALLGLTLFVWFGYARHHGMQAVWFLLCVWLGEALAPEELRAAGATPRGAFRSLELRAGLVAVLVVQPVAGAVVTAQDLARPFSNGRSVADYLAREIPPDSRLVGSIDYTIQPIAAFLDRPFYYPEERRTGTFVDWSPQQRMVSAGQAIDAAADLLETEDLGQLALVLSRPVPIAPGSTLPAGEGARITCTAYFSGAIVPDENYRVFRVERVTREP